VKSPPQKSSKRRPAWGGENAADLIMNIRQMLPSDLDFAASCTAAEGWRSETRPVFEDYLSYDPAGCLVAETSGERVGICVATSYGPYGFVGELIVSKAWRGRGIGRQLLEYAVENLRSRGAHSIFLDGVPAAVPLYERVGFRRVCRSMRFSGTLRGQIYPHARPMRNDDLDAVGQIDRVAFGADRSFFLERRLALQPGLCRVLEKDGGEIAGFVMAKRIDDFVWIGPWVVRPGVERPGDLLEGLAAAAGGEVALGLGVLETATEAMATVRSFGFAERVDAPWRMALGPSAELGTSPGCFAIGSAAKG
jgi:ribosomal protein S18 acetylase RimI-like enzyme